MTDFQQYAKNTAFPIHATFDDDAVDKDSMKAGGFFTKKLYAEELQSAGQKEKGSGDEEGSESEFEGKINGGGDAKFNGFCRTDTVYRAHYRIARMK